MDLGFKGKVALVTGAGSQVGFGKEIAILMAKEGCDKIAVSDMNLADVEKTAAALKAMGCQSLAVKADITQQGRCHGYGGQGSGRIRTGGYSVQCGRRYSA